MSLEALERSVACAEWHHFARLTQFARQDLSRTLAHSMASRSRAASSTSDAAPALEAAMEAKPAKSLTTKKLRRASLQPAGDDDDDAGVAAAAASSSSAAAAESTSSGRRPPKRARPMDEDPTVDPSRRPRAPRTLEEKVTQRRLIVVLEQACLETIKTKSGYELLNSDDHIHLHGKAGRDPADSRPDIAHQLLMTLLDSPLNKAGRLQVYMQTKQKILIEISPHIRIPRTYKRFAGLIVQLLHKMKIKAAGASTTLMRVIKNPVTDHLPPGAPIIGTNVAAELVSPLDLVPTLPDGPVVFVIGAMARGFTEAKYVERSVSFSRFPLSAAAATSRLLAAFEYHWGIL